MDGHEDDFKDASPVVPEGNDATDTTQETEATGAVPAAPEKKMSQIERLRERADSQLSAPYHVAKERACIMRSRDGRDPEPICGIIAIVGNVLATERGSQSVRVACQTISGEIASIEFPRSDLLVARPPFMRQLADEGFPIHAGASAFLALMRSLESHDTVPSALLPGWSPSLESYALQSGEIIAGADLTDDWLPVRSTSKEDVERWFAQIGSKASGNPILMFSILAVLAGCLLRILGKDGLFFHWSGPSSSGKTRILMFASTVFPGLDLSSWQDTPQALTDKARAATDSALFVDDTQPVAADKVGKVIMTLGTGLRPTTRGEMTSSASASKDRLFHVSVQSTGETMISSLLSQAGMQRDGHTARVIDIAVDRDIIAQNLHGASSSYEFMKQIEDAVPTAPRALGPAFVQFILSSSKEARAKWRLHLRRFVSDLAQTIFPEERQIDGVYMRDLEQFAAVKFTAELLVKSELLPISSEEVTACVLSVARIWAADAVETAVPEAERACKLVKDWIVKSDHKLINIGEDGSTGKRGSRRFGFKDEAAYYLTPESLAAAGAGRIEPRRMARYLKQAGWLEAKKSAKSLQYKLYVGAHLTMNVYKIDREHIDLE